MARWGWSFWLVIGIATLVVFFNLGGIPLLDPDEPVYAETAKEMIQFNDFVSPRIYGNYWYDKPPMYYWLVAGTYMVAGISEFTARFPSAILAVIGVAVVYLSSLKLFNRRAAIAGSLVLATSIEYFYLGKAAVTDITLTLCLTICLLAFIQKRYYWFYIFAGLATLTKGPIGLLFPGGIVFFYLLVSRNFSLMKNMKIPTGIMLFLLAGIPWYYVMYQIHGSPFIDTFLGFHNITRFTSPEHPEGVLWYYYIPVLILGLFPWTPVAIQSVWASLNKSSKREYQSLLFFNIWALFIFLFFTISRTKLVSYILPMFPPMAIIIGWYIDRIWNKCSKSTIMAWSTGLGILSVLLVGGMLFGLKAMPVLQTGAIVMAVAILIMAGCSIFFLSRRDIGRAFWSQVTGMVVFSMVLVSLLFPAAAPNFTAVDIAKTFETNYDGKTSVYVIKFLHPGFTFYTNVYGIEIASTEQFARAIETSNRAYFVVRQSDYKSLSTEQQQRLVIIGNSIENLLLLKE